MNNNKVQIWKRILAFFIDFIVLGFIGFFIGFIKPPALKFNILYPIFFIQVFYFILGTYIYGATIGKGILKFGISNDSLKPVSLLQSLTREIIGIFPLLVGNFLLSIFPNNNTVQIIYLLLLGFSLVVFFSILFSKSKSGIHEKISKTCIDNDNYSKYLEILKNKNELSNKYSYFTAVVFFIIFIQFLSTSSRLFNALVGLFVAFFGSRVGIVILDFINRISNSKYPRIQKK